MLAIRLARTGRNKYPTYRIVAAESARATTGKFVAILGHYNPHTKELVIKKEETVKYLSHGAQPSNSVIKLLQREKLELPKWVSLSSRSKSPKKAAQERTAAAAEAAAKPAEAAPVEAVEVEELKSESTQEVVTAEAATENAEAIAETVPDAPVQDTAAGVEALAATVQKAEAAGDVAIAEATAETKVGEAVESDSDKV